MKTKPLMPAALAGAAFATHNGSAADPPAAAPTKAPASAPAQASAVAPRSWRNDANGHGGDVRTLKVYRDEAGRECKQIEVMRSSGGRKGSNQYAACRDASGTWRGDDGTPLS